jgi:hypothetical protein
MQNKRQLQIVIFVRHTMPNRNKLAETITKSDSVDIFKANLTQEVLLNIYQQIQLINPTLFLHCTKNMFLKCKKLFDMVHFISVSLYAPGNTA